MSLRHRRSEQKRWNVISKVAAQRLMPCCNDFSISGKMNRIFIQVRRIKNTLNLYRQTRDQQIALLYQGRPIRHSN